MELTVGQFVTLVREMRNAQIKFEKTRLDQDGLLKHQLEFKVDKAIRERDRKFIAEQEKAQGTLL